MTNWFYKKKNKKGFTLVELVVVIAILGILAALAVPKLLGSRTNAAVMTHNANVRTLEGAANIYLSEHGVPPANKSIKWGPGSEGAIDESISGKYVEKWPTPPKGTGVAEVGDTYTVEIKNDGTVEVLPKALVQASKGADWTYPTGTTPETPEIP